MYEDYESMIKERAWHWSQKTWLNFDDLVTAGAEVYLKCEEKYNPEKGTKFSTYLRSSLDHRFSDIVDREARYTELSAEILRGLQSFDRKSFEEFIEDLDKDAQWLAVQIVRGEAPVVSLPSGDISRKKTRGEIRRWLRSQYNWGLPRVYQTFHKLEKKVNNKAG